MSSRSRPADLLWRTIRQAEQMLMIARRYMSEAAAQQFVSSELANPGPELVVFTIRPDRFLTGPS